MSETVKQFVTETIESNRVVIFSKDYCPYCNMAKEVFNELNQSFVAVEINKRDDGDEIQSVLGDITGGTTVPRVFLDKKFIGGGTDVKKLHASGELKKLLG